MFKTLKLEFTDTIMKVLSWVNSYVYTMKWTKQRYATWKGCLFKNSLEKYMPLLKITNSKQEIDYNVLLLFKTVHKQ